MTKGRNILNVYKISILIFYNIPSKALYLLRNLSQGSEERIFTYDTCQTWW